MWSEFALSAPNLLIGWAAGLLIAVLLVLIYCRPLRLQVQALEACSSFDPLTKLANGTYFRSDVAELQRTSASLVVLYMQLHRLDRQELSARRTTDLRRAAQLLNSAMPRCADRLYRMNTATAQFAAVISDGKEALGSRLALRILERLRSEGLTATVAIATSERLGWCDLALAAELRCQEQVRVQVGTLCLATVAPPLTPRAIPLSEELPELLCAPIAVHS